jgi:7-cyano-7-deazaguanine synthase
MKTLVLLSGGLDSAVVLDLMLSEDGGCDALLFDYGQPHKIELDYARRLADSRAVSHRTVELTHMPLVNDVVFAGRNLVLASHAVAIAAAEGFRAVALGCNQSDHDRFPDCRPAFWRAVNEATRSAYGVSVYLPLLRMSKTQVVKLAKDRGVAIDRTWSCYNPQNDKPCGVCLACKTRTEAGA